jgi:DNA mismatch repair protein MutL
MTILALPQVTVRILGASQVLTDPASVVKELVDNALDAHASSIAIEINSNTLDCIQVRDNGHGIPPEDRPLVARPHCTSKIGSEEDLKDIGGSSLGFRGEALASIAEMSGSVTISTRVEGEAVATSLKISQQGEVVSQDRASMPIGTTVKITDFIKSNPVRKQVALKATEKTLKKIKQILQCYAFARPHVRYSLRVLKAKSDRDNWVYAPKPGGNAEDAAFKIVGSACASQCTWSVVEEHGFTVQAFLPRSDADVHKVSNFGHFLSVDGRPMSVTRGTMKQILKIFKEALKAANSPLHAAKELFIYIEISCPPASYDANVEPSKDEVLFEDSEHLLGAVRRLFGTVYPSQQSATAPTIDVAQPEPTPRGHGTFEENAEFTTSLEPQPFTDLSSMLLCGSHGIRGHSPETIVHDLHGRADQDAINKSSSFRTNMYGCDEEDLSLLDARPPTGRTEADFEELRQARNDVHVSNPWVMAKLNSSVRQPPIPMPDVPHSALETDSPHQSTPFNQPRISLASNALPTPRPSSPSGLPQDFHPSDHVPGNHFARDGRRIGAVSLPAPQAYARPSSPTYSNATDGLQDVQVHHTPAYDYTLSSQADPPAGTPLSSIPEAVTRPRRSPHKQLQQSKFNNPFVSPIVDRPEHENVWFDHLEGIENRRKRQPQPSGGNGLVTQGELGDLVDDPRPITPPRRNRDMRDFLQFANLTGDDSNAPFLESGYHTAHGRARVSLKRQIPESELEVGHEVSDGNRVLSLGFMRASDLNELDTENALPASETHRPTKRRRTSESRVLQELSSNGAGAHGDDEEYIPEKDVDATPQRRRTTNGKLGRRKSSRLPLERIPASRATYNMTLKVHTECDKPPQKAYASDTDAYLGWSKPLTNFCDVFSTMKDPRLISRMADKLRQLLVNRVSGREMVQDLSELLHGALTRHAGAEGDVNEV